MEREWKREKDEEGRKRRRRQEGRQREAASFGWKKLQQQQPSFEKKKNEVRDSALLHGHCASGGHPKLHPQVRHKKAGKQAAEWSHVAQFFLLRKGIREDRRWAVTHPSRKTA
jgi:hypothetical protein